jgi:hypothetical protein
LAFAAAERFFCVWLIRIIAIVFYASVASAAFDFSRLQSTCQVLWHSLVTIEPMSSFPLCDSLHNQADVVGLLRNHRLRSFSNIEFAFDGRTGLGAVPQILTTSWLGRFGPRFLGEMHRKSLGVGHRVKQSTFMCFVFAFLGVGTKKIYIRSTPRQPGVIAKKQILLIRPGCA